MPTVAVDNFPSTYDWSVLAPAIHAVAVTPDNANGLPNVTRFLFVGIAGDVKVTMLGGEQVTLTGLAAGVLHPIRVMQVWATGTTATGIVALY